MVDAPFTLACTICAGTAALAWSLHSRASWTPNCTPPPRVGRLTLGEVTESEIPMANTQWFMWMAFVLIFLLIPMGYGWGYRGWGPPYPRYVQRRRGARAVAIGGVAADHHSWGYTGDLLWGGVFLGVGWVFLALWIR
jgi:hypothetical protein